MLGNSFRSYVCCRYYAGSLASEEMTTFLTEAVMVWEYASNRVQTWKEGLGLERVSYVRCPTT
jgi:hypothetical protein